MSRSVSIMEPLRARKRALSAPSTQTKVIRTDGGPNPWAALKGLEEHATRTASALAELAVQTTNLPETWLAQHAIVEAVTHEMLVLDAARTKAWERGISHGKWQAEKDMESRRPCLDKVTSLQAKLYDLQLRFDVLQGQYDEAKAIIARSSLRDISNTLSNLSSTA